MVTIRSDLHPSLARLRVSYRELTQRISELVGETPQRGAGAADLFAAMADASRTAESFPDAIRAALIVLRDEVAASSAILFSRQAPDQPYRCTASSHTHGAGRRATQADWWLSICRKVRLEQPFLCCLGIAENTARQIHYSELRI